jgi:hypothetical protein
LPIEDAGVEHVADEVYLCRTCGRLVFRCVAEDCQALNRPYSEFCRRCGRTQQPATGISAARRWEEVQRFDFVWKYRNDGAAGGQPGIQSHSQPVETSVVQILNDIKGVRPPKVLMEWASIDGLLAIHQGGGFLALINPFGDLAVNPHGSSVVWTRPEDDLLRQLDSDGPFVSDGNAEDLRPFVPIATADRKHVIFSNPYAVISVQLGSLPGWHHRAESHASVEWLASSSMETWLAAAPVPLTSQPAPIRRDQRLHHEPVPNKIGLLLFDSQTKRHVWKVLGLDSDPASDGRTAVGGVEPPAGEIVVPIVGNPVQILSFRDQYLVFATPVGHWLWSVEDARRGDVASVLPLLTDPEASDIVLDAEVQTRSVFSWQNQHLLKRHDHETSRRGESTRQHFELCYARFRNGRYDAWRRSIWPGDRDGTKEAPAQPVFRDRPARPLGDCISFDDDGTREMLFLVDSAGELFRRPITGGDPHPMGNIQTGRLTEIYGFRFHDPLLVVVRKDTSKDNSNDAMQAVELRSLRHPERRAIAEKLLLRADPLPWSNFLFTCEETERGGLCVIRREYLVELDGQRPGTDTHVFRSSKAFAAAKPGK